MKRALLIFVAALIVLFACPSTDSMAGTPTVFQPTLSAKPDPGGDPVGVDGADEDDGDADGVAGYTSKRGLGGTQLGSGFEQELNYLKLWWNLFFWFRS